MSITYADQASQELSALNDEFNSFKPWKKWLFKKLGFRVGAIAYQLKSISDDVYYVGSLLEQRQNQLELLQSINLAQVFPQLGDVVTIDYNTRTDIVSLDYRTSFVGNQPNPLIQAPQTEGSIAVNLSEYPSLEHAIQKLLALAKEQTNGSAILIK